MGQGDDYADLYRQYLPRIHNYVRLRVDSEDLAQDLTAAAFERAVARQHTLRNPEAFGAWLFRIARNLQVDRFRHNRLKLVNDDQAIQAEADGRASPERFADDLDCGERLKQGLVGLPPEQRDAFLLKEEGGLSLEQVARIMDAGRETVKSRLRYALKRLRQLLEDCL